jgi:dTDP-4-amino-4,6-dideoxygalactose transaminase
MPNLKTEARVYGKLYLQAISKVIFSGNYILGEEVLGFEKEFSHFLGAKYCLGVGNGLEAIQMALMAVGIGKEDEVITTPLTAAATTMAILAVGAKPIFVDTNNQGQMDETQVEDFITKKTKAILPVHLYGHASRVDVLKKLCHKHQLFLIEDACQAHGSQLNDQYLGTFGTFGCFSFYPTKNLGALGDGGAVVTNDKKLAEKVRMLRDYGQKKKYRHDVNGLNSRLDELQAAVLRVKLKQLPKDNLKRKAIFKRYLKNLKHNQNIEIINGVEGSNPNWHLLVVKTAKRAKLQSFLTKAGIATAIHFPTLVSRQPFAADLKLKTSLPQAEKLTKQVLSLPCDPFLSLKEVDQICSKVNDCLGK